MHRRGVSLAGYLMAMTTFAVFVVTMVGIASHHLQFASEDYAQQGARNLAEEAINRALLDVLNSQGQKFGIQRLPTEVVRVDSSVYPAGSHGIVCFHPETADREKCGLSTNNLFGSGMVTGDLDRGVPVNTVHLIGTGYCARARKSIEMLYYVPPFPSALASEGPVHSRGGLLVAGIKDPTLFPGTYGATPPENKAPSHVFSNFNGPEAVNLGPGAQIQGNVGAVGGIVLDSSVQVSGEVRDHTDPQPLPQLNLGAIFGRLGSQLGTEVLNSDVAGDYSLEWNARATGSLRITGQLQLHQGVLYVPGDLVVEGGVTGQGAIYVGGQTTIRRGADFQANDQVALVSRNRVVLEGAGQNDYFFQGLLYSESDIAATDVTVLGAVIARGLGGLQLDNVNLLNSPVTLTLIDGVVLPNASDDDTVQILIRVEDRDRVTHKPTSYKVELRGVSDDVGGNDLPVASVSAPIRATGLRNYDEIKSFIENSDRSIWGPYAKNSFHLDWYWNADSEHVAAYGANPLKTYLEVLEGTRSDPDGRFAINVNPNEVLGIVNRPRVLLWQEAPIR